MLDYESGSAGVRLVDLEGGWGSILLQLYCPFFLNTNIFIIKCKLITIATLNIIDMIVIYNNNNNKCNKDIVIILL